MMKNLGIMGAVCTGLWLLFYYGTAHGQQHGPMMPQSYNEKNPAWRTKFCEENPWHMQCGEFLPPKNVPPILRGSSHGRN